MRSPILFLFLLFVMTIHSGMAEAQIRFGTVQYPAYGNIDPAEGSIVCRFRIDEDMGKADSPYQPRQYQQWNRFVIFHVTFGTDSHMMLFWKPGKSDPGGIAVSLKIDEKSVLPPRDRGYRHSSGWRQGSIHTVALSWTREKAISLWLDGVMVEQVNGSPDSVKALGELAPRSGRIELGAQGSSSAIAIYAFHILDTPLRSAELGKNDDSLFSVRPESLLLDVFDGRQPFEPDGKTQTRARVISGYSGEQGGTPDGNCVFGHDACGAFLKLYK